MTISQAGDWYRDALDLIPSFVAQAPTAAERLDSAWDVKSRLRLAAALALYDQRLVREWFATFPLPSVDELLDLAERHCSASAEAFALDLLLKASAEEERAFPSTVGEALGMTVHNVEGRSWRMTKDGWEAMVPSSRSYLLLPNPALVADLELAPISQVWVEPPAIGPFDDQTHAPCLLLESGALWLSYLQADGRGVAAVKFEYCIEHQLSRIDPSSLEHHCYASAGLEPLAFNELSKSAQTVYWAPLGPRHWVVSLCENTLDVVATSAEVVGFGIKAQSTGDALRRLVFGEGV